MVGAAVHLRRQLEDRAAQYARDDRWAPVPEELDRAIAHDVELAKLARALRVETIPLIQKRLASLAVSRELDERFYLAWLDTPRERFVLPDDIARSCDDEPVALDPDGRATVSAPHAYLLTFALLDLGEADRLLELGTGTGYGAALARKIVGRRGHVTTLEIDPVLQERAARLLGEGGRDEAAVLSLFADGRTAPRAFDADPKPNKIAYTYALPEDPVEAIRAMPPGAVLVAPVGRSDADQVLVRVEHLRGDNGSPRLERTTHGAVRYVPER